MTWRATRLDTCPNGTGSNDDDDADADADDDNIDESDSDMTHGDWRLETVGRSLETGTAKGTGTGAGTGYLFSLFAMCLHRGRQ